ncbi:HlyC/CorC family transporter [bacterium]|nr:HlyC/CorC family transporter [bacterium]
MVSEIVIVVLLILLNGLFSMSEMAVVSARKNRLVLKAEGGNQGAATALQLADNPNRFLSTVQIGITLIGILSGAFGGATIAEQIGLEINKIPALAPYSEGIGVGIVVIVITYLSLVLGELVPKRLALNNAENVAAAVSPLMKTLSKVTTPIVAVLSGSTNLVLRVLGIRPSDEPPVTEEDLRSMLDQGTESGIFEESEQDMVERIFRLSDRSISALMTPRPDVVFLDIDATHEEIHQKIARYPFSRFPVIQDSPDNILGIVQSRDLLLQRVDGPHFDVRNALQQPVFIPEATPALDVLEQFKATGSELAIIIDEYGGVLGLVSMNDILEAIVGDMLTPGAQQEAEAIRREDGSWLFDGMISADEVKEFLELDELPDRDEGNYETLSGLMMAQLGRIPASGDHFEWNNLRFEVVDMDGRRVDKVLVTTTKT